MPKSLKKLHKNDNNNCFLTFQWNTWEPRKLSGPSANISQNKWPKLGTFKELRWGHPKDDHRRMDAVSVQICKGLDGKLSLEFGSLIGSQESRGHLQHNDFMHFQKELTEARRSQLKSGSYLIKTHCYYANEELLKISNIQSLNIRLSFQKLQKSCMLVFFFF